MNPQLIGSGIKLKGLIAMVHGKALVTTSAGAEGVPGKQADEWKDLAQLLIDLLADLGRARTIGMQGRAFVAETYDQDKLNSSVSSLLRAIV